MTPDQEHELSVLRAIRASSSAPMTDYLLHATKISIMSGCYEVFRSAQQPVGFCIWANTVRESLFRLQRNGQHPFFVPEWNEGSITLIIDVCFLPLAKPFSFHLIRKFLRAFRVVAYRKGARTVLKAKCRSRFRSIDIRRLNRAR